MRSQTAGRGNENKGTGVSPQASNLAHFSTLTKERLGNGGFPGGVKKQASRAGA